MEIAEINYFRKKNSRINHRIRTKPKGYTIYYAIKDRFARKTLPLKSFEINKF